MSEDPHLFGRDLLLPMDRYDEKRRNYQCLDGKRDQQRPTEMGFGSPVLIGGQNPQPA